MGCRIDRLEGITGAVSRGKQYLSPSVGHAKGRRRVLSAVEMLSYLLVVGTTSCPVILLNTTRLGANGLNGILPGIQDRPLPVQT